MSILQRISGLALASSLLAATPAVAGLNSQAHCRLTWGANFSTEQTNVATPEGKDTQVFLWVSAVGLRNFRGADIQLVVAPTGTQSPGAALPNGWQFQSNVTTPCDGNDQNLVATKSFPGSAFTNVPWVAQAQDGMLFGTPDRSPTFRGLWVIWFTAAGSEGAACDPAQRYGIAEFKLTLSGTKCPGVAAPVKLTPALLTGYQIEPFSGQPLVALVDGNLQLDAVPFDPGFAGATANVNGTDASAAVHERTWGQIKRMYTGR